MSQKTILQCLLILIILLGTYFGPIGLASQSYSKWKKSQITNHYYETNPTQSNSFNLAQPHLGEVNGQSHTIWNGSYYALVFVDDNASYYNIIEVNILEGFTGFHMNDMYEQILPKSRNVRFTGLSYNGEYFATIEIKSVEGKIDYRAIIFNLEAEIISNTSINLNTIAEIKNNGVDKEGLTIKILQVKSISSIITIQNKSRNLSLIISYDWKNGFIGQIFEATYDYRDAINIDENDIIWFYHRDTLIDQELIEEGYLGYQIDNLSDIENRNIDSIISIKDASHSFSRPVDDRIGELTFDYLSVGYLVYNHHLISIVEGLPTNVASSNYLVGADVIEYHNPYLTKEETMLIFTGFFMLIMGIILLYTVKKENIENFSQLITYRQT